MATTPILHIILLAGSIYNTANTVAGAVTLPWLWSNTNSSSSSSTLVSSSSSSRNSTALDVILHIDVLEVAPAEVGAGVPPMSLESVIRNEINGSWERAQLAMSLVNETHTPQLREALYVAVWRELQASSKIYDAQKILDFYEQLQRQGDAPVALRDEVYQAFVARSTQLLAAPFHTSSRSARFPLTQDLLHRLTFNTIDTLRIILNALYDAVLALETPLSVVQRLSNYTASVTQLTLANLQLLGRPEMQGNRTTEARAALQQNLRELLQQPEFELEVDASLRQHLYAQLPLDERILFSASKVCLGNVSDPGIYVYECPQTYLICSNNDRDPKRAAYYVQRGHGANNTLQFAFYSAYWRNRYIVVEPPTTSTSSARSNNNNNTTFPATITKNVYSRSTIDWWRVQYVTEGVVLHHVTTGNLVLCGGNPQYWDGEERHVYTRRVEALKRFPQECVWRVEDCSDVA